MLIERIGMGCDFNPFAAAGDHRQHRRLGIDDPHIVLQLRHVFFGCGFLRERPWQHELCFEHGAASFDATVEGRRHPADHRMLDVPLDVADDLTGIELVPAPVEVLGDSSELHDEVAGEVLRYGFAALFAPEPQECGFIVAHDDPGVRTADEIPPLIIDRLQRRLRHCQFSSKYEVSPLSILKVSDEMPPKSILKVSIRQVKAARALLAWSQEQLATAADVSIPTIKRLEAQDGP